MNDYQKYKRGQIWYCDESHSPVERGVIAKARPVLIVSDDSINQRSSAVTVLPITSSSNSKKWRVVEFKINNEVSNYITLDQTQTVSCDRLAGYKFTLSDEKMKEVMEKYIGSLVSDYKVSIDIKKDITKLPIDSLTAKYNISKKEIYRILNSITTINNEFV